MPELPTPSAETIRRARLFWEQGGADLKSARALLRSGEYIQSSYHSLQGAVNALSAICHLHGHFQLPSGGASMLLTLVAGGAPALAKQIGALEALERVTDRNPFAPADPAEDLAAYAKACLAEGERVVKTLQAYLKAHRQAYFTP